MVFVQSIFYWMISIVKGSLEQNSDGHCSKHLSAVDLHRKMVLWTKAVTPGILLTTNNADDGLVPCLTINQPVQATETAIANARLEEVAKQRELQEKLYREELARIDEMRRAEQARIAQEQAEYHRQQEEVGFGSVMPISNVSDALSCDWDRSGMSSHNEYRMCGGFSRLDVLSIEICFLTVRNIQSVGMCEVQRKIKSSSKIPYWNA